MNKFKYKNIDLKFENIDLTIEETKQLLYEHQCRIVDDEIYRNGLVSKQLQVFYDEKWYTVCRTDYYDRVSTGLGINNELLEWMQTATIDQWREMWTRHIIIGAFINNERNYIEIIDRVSDG